MVDTRDSLEKGPAADGSARRAGGRARRKVLRAIPVPLFKTLVRNIPFYDVLPNEAVELIHDESCRILEDVGIEFRDDDAAAIWKASGGHFLGTAHTLKKFENAFFLPSIMDFNNFEQWAAGGAQDAAARALAKARTLLDTYEEPKLDEGIHEALKEFVTRRERELPDHVS